MAYISMPCTLTNMYWTFFQFTRFFCGYCVSMHYQYNPSVFWGFASSRYCCRWLCDILWMSLCTLYKDGATLATVWCLSTMSSRSVSYRTSCVSVSFRTTV